MKRLMIVLKSGKDIYTIPGTEEETNKTFEILKKGWRDTSYMAAPDNSFFIPKENVLYIEKVDA